MSKYTQSKYFEVWITCHAEAERSTNPAVHHVAMQSKINADCAACDNPGSTAADWYDFAYRSAQDLLAHLDWNGDFTKAQKTGAIKWFARRGIVG